MFVFALNLKKILVKIFCFSFIFSSPELNAHKVSL